MLSDSGQVTRLLTVRLGQQRQELIAIVSGRDTALLEEPDRRQRDSDELKSKTGVNHTGNKHYNLSSS